MLLSCHLEDQDDHLGDLNTGLLGRDQVSLITAFPLDDKHDLARGISINILNFPVLANFFFSVSSFHLSPGLALDSLMRLLQLRFLGSSQLLLWSGKHFPNFQKISLLLYAVYGLIFIAVIIGEDFHIELFHFQ